MGSTKDPYSNVIGRGNTSTIEVLADGSVRKTIDLESKTTRRLNKFLRMCYPGSEDSVLLVQHEVGALNRLSEFDIAPKVLRVESASFVMSNVGVPVKRATKFNNLKARVKYILECLDRVKVSHNDLRDRFQNYTCLNGVLYLVDFQMADVGSIRPSMFMRKKLKPRSWNDREDLEWLIQQFRG